MRKIYYNPVIVIDGAFKGVIGELVSVEMSLDIFPKCTIRVDYDNEITVLQHQIKKQITMIKKGKTLTREIVFKLGLDKASVITADMLEGYTSIAGYAFCGCCAFTSVPIPEGVISIADYAFYGCSRLPSVTDRGI